MLVAGHGMRLMHLRHHARPLAPDDVEGVGAALKLFQAIAAGPQNAAQYRIEAFRVASPRERVWLISETLTAVVFAAAAWVVVNVVLQLTASAWASHLPHRPPEVLVKLARHLEWTHSAVVASLLHHLWHHRFPSLPISLARLSTSRCYRSS